MVIFIIQSIIFGIKSFAFFRTSLEVQKIFTVQRKQPLFYHRIMLVINTSSLVNSREVVLVFHQHTNAETLNYRIKPPQSSSRVCILAAPRESRLHIITIQKFLEYLTYIHTFNPVIH